MNSTEWQTEGRCLRLLLFFNTSKNDANWKTSKERKEIQVNSFIFWDFGARLCEEHALFSCTHVFLFMYFRVPFFIITQINLQCYLLYTFRIHPRFKRPRTQITCYPRFFNVSICTTTTIFNIKHKFFFARITCDEHRILSESCDSLCVCLSAFVGITVLFSKAGLFYVCLLSFNIDTQKCGWPWNKKRENFCCCWR